MRQIFSFPNPVNEHAARWVAFCVVLLASGYLVSSSIALLWALALGFVARVFTGPSLSPIGQLATRVLVPLMGREPKLVPGPPKRFAQAIGTTLSVSALALAITGFATAAFVLVALIVTAASLESLWGLCLGCKIFAGLMTVGLIPKEVCEACLNITKRAGVEVEVGVPSLGID